MNISPETIEKIKSAADIVEVIGQSVALKKNGKDHFGLCPFHSEKSPSFSVAQDKGIFYCFGCGAAGDVFEFLVKKNGIPFLDAVKQLAGQYNISLPDGLTPGQSYTQPIKSQTAKPCKAEFTPDRAQPPAEIWQEKAEKLVNWAHENLLKNDNRITWLEKRGINLDLVKEFMLGWNPGDEKGGDLYRHRESWGLEPAYKDDGKTQKKLWIPVGFIIPLIINDEVERIRIRTERDNPKYYVLPGSGMRCMVLGGACRAYVIIESELDGIMVYGKIRINKIGVIALGSAQRKPEIETYELLKKAPVILNALDYDQAGRKAIVWWEERFPDNHKRWPSLHGKDPGDAYKAGLDIAEWIRAGLPEAWNWKVSDQFPGTIGRSNLLNDNKRGQSQQGYPLKELASLVKTSPVVISVAPGRLNIKEAPSWALSNPDKSSRISELVFLNKEVRSFLMGLGSAELNGKNIESRISDIGEGL